MANLNIRERYLATMGRVPGVRTPYWEFGYWVATVERWYLEGLPRSPFSPPLGMPSGNGVFGGGLPFPHMPGLVRYRDVDVHQAMCFDPGTMRIPVNWRCCPAFTEQVIEEDAETRLMVNGEGVKQRVRKDNDSLPHFLSWPVRDRASWERMKEERLSMADVSARFPSRWAEQAPAFQGRDFPLGVVMDGFFAAPREFLGVERQLTMYYDDPALMHDINAHLCTLWLATLEELLRHTSLDFVYIWEDMAYKNGPLISPKMFHAFLVPHYKRLTAFLRDHGIDIIFVDTDGLCTSLIPGFVEGGVTGIYPFEVQAGMDIVAVRRRFPQLLIQGGLDKTKVAAGREAIDAELEAKLPFMLSDGGYIPYCDHLVPPDVPWENFVYFRDCIRRYVEQYQPERQ